MAYVTFTQAVAGQVATASFINNNNSALASQFNGNVDSTNLASNAVTTAKIATGAVTGVKIAMGSDAQGDILFRGASNYQRLAAGTSGQILKTLGAGANPLWVDNTGGTWVSVQSGTVSAGSSFTVSSLEAGAKYKLIVNMIQNTSASDYRLTFNSDTGSNYKWAGIRGVAASANGDGSSSDTKVVLNRSGSDVSATFPFFAELLISPYASTNNNQLVLGISHYVNGTAPAVNGIAGSYAGAASLSSLTITTAAGTMTGSWTLYKLS